MVVLLQQWNHVSSFMSPLLRLSCCSAILSSIFPQGIVPLFEPKTLDMLDNKSWTQVTSSHGPTASPMSPDLSLCDA
jgi:hypothetical protein